MSKKLISLILATVMMLTLAVPVMAETATDWTDFNGGTASQNDDGTVTLTMGDTLDENALYTGPVKKTNLSNETFTETNNAITNSFVVEINPSKMEYAERVAFSVALNDSEGNRAEAAENSIEYQKDYDGKVYFSIGNEKFAPITKDGFYEIVTIFTKTEDNNLTFSCTVKECNGENVGVDTHNITGGGTAYTTRYIWCVGSSNPEAEIVVGVPETEEETYTITTSVADGKWGKITETATVTAGTDFVVTMEADATSGMIAGATIDGTWYNYDELEDVKYYFTWPPYEAKWTFKNVQENHTVELKTEDDAFKVVMTKTGNGKIVRYVQDQEVEVKTAIGGIFFGRGCDWELHFKPDDGYVIGDVKVNGKSIGAVESYTYPKETTGINHTLDVTFVEGETKIEKSELTEVPEEFKNIPELNTVEKIETAMKTEIKKIDSTIPEANVENYDVKLMIKNSDGTWIEATEENFPAKGLTITLPYPAGTSASTHDFVVVHMFTKGDKAGQIEMPKVTETKNGIQFTVTSLSPISLGWKEAKTTTGGGNVTVGGGSSSSSNPAQDFWYGVRKEVEASDKGDIVTVNAEDYNSLPWYVMDAARANGVGLKIEWDGKTIKIPAGKALNEKYRTAYPFEYLAKYNFDKMMAEEIPAVPETGAPVNAVILIAFTLAIAGAGTAIVLKKKVK